MNRSESKYFATSVRMDQAFLELIAKKDFAYITVKEVCEKAGVNRSTFYLHYETLGDLLAESAQYMIDQFIAFMHCDIDEFLEKIQNCRLEELYLVTPEYLMPYLVYVKENRRIFQAIIAQASILQMDDAYQKLNTHVLTPILNRYQVPMNAQKYMMQFFMNGLIAIINEWIKDDCKDSIEHIVSVIQLCIRKF